ncbi:MAG: hypothetical protein M1826_003842 [Phylliscum demangeonii]|nr:MAG: hypothetical protein M1826_003842 [Phylliscum demangeonii]
MRSLLILASAALLTSPPIFVHGLSSAAIGPDTPVSSLISAANAHLAQGEYHDALRYFDAAIAHDAHNYLTIFKRGATYLSLGKAAQASHDFDRVLDLKPDFEGALTQRARLRAKHGDWAGAQADYRAAGGHAAALQQLEEAQGAAGQAERAAADADWAHCVTYSSVAIATASTARDLRQLRARCRLEKGEVREAVGDLSQVLALAPAETTPHLQLAALLFYSLAEPDRGLAQIRKCLHSDPDSKACSGLFRPMKAVEKRWRKARELMEQRMWNSAAKLLVRTGTDPGLLADVARQIQDLKAAGTIHPNAGDDLLATLTEMTCEAYYMPTHAPVPQQMKSHAKGEPYCTQALEHDPHSLYGQLHRAQRALDSGDAEAALAALRPLHDQHPDAPAVQQLLQQAQAALHQAQRKDYYQVLQVARDADARTIKRAYRLLTRQHHPDKAVKKTPGLSREAAEKKMAAINEAYDVLRDPELRARFDRGDDPNSSQPAMQQQGNPFSFFQHAAGGGNPQFVFRSDGGPAGGAGGAGGAGAGAGFQFPDGFQFPGGGGFQFGGGPA